MAIKSRLKLGTSGDDTLNGTDQGEIFFGFGGNDTIFAGGGNDHAFGGRGNDLIFGGNGNDHLFGGRGNDALVGEAGNDHLVGGRGRDLLVGGPGKDVMVGGADNDTFLIRQGTGTDTIADLQPGDRIDIRDFHFASFQAVLNAAHQSHDDVVIALGGGDQLVIGDAKLSDLHAEQFIISSQITGPSSSQTPYLVSANSHVTVESLITTGDQAPNGYTMVGIPDGLGAFDNGNGTFTVLMNHEISNSNPALAGVVRAHGANGAFVSEWVIDKTTLQVLSGHDLTHDAWLFDTATQTYVDHNAALGNGVSFSRFCSADLADANAFYNPATGLGFNPADGRLFLDGEENNAEGRAMAHIVGGAAGRQQLRARLARQHGLREPARQPVHRRQDRGRDAQRHGGGRQQRRRLDVFRQRPRRGLLLCRGQAVDRACDRQGRAHRRRHVRRQGGRNGLRDRSHHQGGERLAFRPGGGRQRGQHVRRCPQSHRRPNREQQPGWTRDRLRAAGRRRMGHDRSQQVLFRHYGEHYRSQQAVGARFHRREKPDAWRQHQNAARRNGRPADVRQHHGEPGWEDHVV